MDVVDLSISKKEEMENKTDYLGDAIRDEIMEYAKDFKTSWLKLGRHLYAVYQDKLFHGWGFNKFEDYTEEELGLKKSLCTKLLKAYLFIEQDEPVYLESDFSEKRDPINVPNYDSVDVLRLAKTKKDLTTDEYGQLRAFVFDKGKDAGAVRKELTAMMKEREEVDPDEERDRRNEAAIKKLLGALSSFKKDMTVLKLCPDEIVQEAEQLMEKLESQV